MASPADDGTPLDLPRLQGDRVFVARDLAVALTACGEFLGGDRYCGEAAGSEAAGHIDYLFGVALSPAEPAWLDAERFEAAVAVARRVRDAALERLRQRAEPESAG